MYAILTDNLSKSYGRRQALDGVSLRVPTGSRFGFLGPNGAGKTTTIRLLLGLLRATAGSAEVLGGNSWHDGPRLRAQIGYLPGDVRFYDHFTGRRMLAFLAAARGGVADAEIHRLTRQFDLDLNRRIRAYSRGMKQKLGLIQALMHRPRLLILDEPTTALDPLVREVLADELRRVSADGRTVLFSSHTLSEVEDLCDWVAILRDGRLIEQERIETLRLRAVRQVELVFEHDAQAAGASLPPALRILHRGPRSLSGTWTGPPAPLLQWLHGVSLRDIRISPPDLEHLFLAYYEHEPRPAQDPTTPAKVSP